VTDVGLLVVGAGPHALTLLTYLHHYGGLDRHEVLVADPRDWMSAWRERFAAHEIPMLRSACVHHPHPDPYALLAFGRAAGRSDFHERPGRPGTALFDDFCDHLIADAGLRALRREVGVRRLTPVAGRAGAPDHVRAVLADGTEVTASRVVVAANPIRPLLPAWSVAHGLRRGRPVRCRQGRVQLGHGDDVDLDRDTVRGSRVLVVGGGLTAAQLALGAARRGAEVVVAHRAATRLRDLDVDASWLGGSLRELHRVPSSVRPAVLRAARGGGTVPPREAALVRELDRSGALRWREHSRVSEVRQHAERWRVGLDGGPLATYDAVWLATGHALDADAGPAGRLLRDTDVVGGLPLLAPDLSIPGTRVHVMGGHTALQTGPVCRTLMGARIASERLLPVLGVSHAPRLYPHPPAG
jgi:glycine/D-amino acid oxidase-like deaminating enzyme